MSLALILTLAQVSADPGAIKARETAYARIALAEKIATDSDLVKAIKAKNAAAETDTDIQKKDKEWQVNPRHPLRKELIQNACAARMKTLLSADSIVVEAFLMDAKGAIVCATHETSDYWQGDEAKWQKTFQEGKKVFLDEPALDASTGLYAVQLSALVSDAGVKIGAVTLTLKVPR